MSLFSLNQKAAAIERVLPLLNSLVSTHSFSGEEEGTAALLYDYLVELELRPSRIHKNIVVTNQHACPEKPTILLLSHHDTVRPSSNWTYDPFQLTRKGDKLHGLGCNDAGLALVSLLQVFLVLNKQATLPFNVIWVGAAEEEVSGALGIRSVLPQLPTIDFAVVGEPTSMNIAVAEKGLMVLDCIAQGKGGHAAHLWDGNAIDVALQDIQWVHSYRDPNPSSFLGPAKLTTTCIQGGSAHNVVPDICSFTIDVRSTDTADNDLILSLLEENISSKITPRSTHLRPSIISVEHPFVKAALSVGSLPFGSSTMSDQALLHNIDSVKLGPGDTTRSHTADEFIYMKEIEKGMQSYFSIFETFIANWE